MHAPPRRIVSLVPSQTELLHYLGLDEEVTGITKFCIHPEAWFRGKTRVGGTKLLNIETIRSLQPDLIIANKEENVKEQVEALSLEFPVWTSDINNLDDACNMIAAIGSMVDKEAPANDLVRAIRQEFDQLAAFIDSDRGILRTAYLIWRQPYMTVGHDTFIHDMMARCGLENIFAAHSRYPSTSIPDIKAADCQVLLLSSEPFPFSQKHINELQPQLPGTTVMLADGEMFSWYGSRLLKAAKYFKDLRQEMQINVKSEK